MSIRPSGDTAGGFVFDDFVDKQVVHVSATSFRSGAERVSMVMVRLLGQHATQWVMLADSPVSQAWHPGSHHGRGRREPRRPPAHRGHWHRRHARLTLLVSMALVTFLTVYTIQSSLFGKRSWAACWSTASPTIYHFQYFFGDTVFWSLWICCGRRDYILTWYIL